MVDLRKAKVGDMAKFRCGGEAKITFSGNAGIMIGGMNWYHSSDGKWAGDPDECPFDIIEIIPIKKTTPLEYFLGRPRFGMPKDQDILYKYIYDLAEAVQATLSMKDAE